jgi:hypothetical protein
MKVERMTLATIGLALALCIQAGPAPAQTAPATGAATPASAPLAPGV